MSDVLLPSQPGLTWDTTKVPIFATDTERSISLRETRVSLAPYPLYRFRHAYSVLRADAAFGELQSLLGFFLARRGSWDSWLFADPNDSVALLEPFGTGNGTQTAFQLARTLGAFTEPTKNVAASPSIYKAGVLQTSGYTISSTGLVTFASAPGSGQALTWSGTFYFRCRWEQDEMEFNEFAQRLYEARECGFIGSLGRLV